MGDGGCRGTVLVGLSKVSVPVVAGVFCLCRPFWVTANPCWSKYVDWTYSFSTNGHLIEASNPTMVGFGRYREVLGQDQVWGGSG